MKEGTEPLLNIGDGLASGVLGDLLRCRNDLGAAVAVAGIETEEEVHNRGALNETTSGVGMGSETEPTVAVPLSTGESEGTRGRDDESDDTLSVPGDTPIDSADGFT